MQESSLERFVIVTQPRSGSYHLVSLLDSADDVRCFGEVFKKRAVELPALHLKALGMKKNDMKVRDHDSGQFLDDLFNIEDKPIQGFKAFLEHLEPAGLKDPSQQPDWKYIYLTRNAVSSFVSGKRAEKTGVYVMDRATLTTPEARYKAIEIDTSRLEKWLIWQDELTNRWLNYRAVLGPDRIHLIDYRDLASMQHLNALLGFLGSFAAGEDLKSDLRKQFDRPFWEGIKNATQVREFLCGSAWANLLSELDEPLPASRSH